MDLSVTAAYIKILNTQSAFPSTSLLHLHVNQKTMLKRNKQTNNNNNNKNPILKGRQKRI